MIDTGILQGVSHLLLVYDQDEVRKIIKTCQGVIEYIKVRDKMADRLFITSHYTFHYKKST